MIAFICSILGSILNLLVEFGGIFCKFYPPGIHCLLFLGEPDFTELADIQQKLMER